MKVIQELKNRGYTDRDIEITEEPTIALVREALGR